MPSQQTDAELIAACIKGEAAAWEALVERYAGLVYAIALRSGLPQDDAADVFQTVFAALLEHMRSIHTPQGLAAWLITTTKREVWHLLRREERQGTDSPAPELFSEAAKGRLDARESENLLADRALIGEALAAIGERCRTLLSLLYLDPAEPSYEEISRKLQMPPGSIGPTRARCLEKMRSVLRTMGMSEA